MNISYNPYATSLPLPLAAFLLLGPLLALQICSYLLARRCVSSQNLTYFYTHTHTRSPPSCRERSIIHYRLHTSRRKAIFSECSVSICSLCQCSLPIVEVSWSFFLIIINGMFSLFIPISIITVSFFRLACCVFPTYFLIRAENNMTHFMQRQMYTFCV